MPRIKGRLQQEGEAYADYLMWTYQDPVCASKIENWRNRLTGKHDVEKYLSLNHKFNYRQAKQIVTYAKSYIKDMINNYNYRLGSQ